jgi:hypothetical protein
VAKASCFIAVLTNSILKDPKNPHKLLSVPNFIRFKTKYTCRNHVKSTKILLAFINSFFFGGGTFLFFIFFLIFLFIFLLGIFLLYIFNAIPKVFLVFSNNSPQPLELWSLPLNTPFPRYSGCHGSLPLHGV